MIISLLFKLFYTFFKIGIFTFGGGYAMIPLITQEVLNNNWVDNTDVLIDFIAIAESTPGTFAINIATFIGFEQANVWGAIAATLGVILPSFVIILIIATLFTKFATNKYVQGFLNGIRPVVPGIILSVAMIFILRSVFQVEHLQFEDFTFEIGSFAILLIVFTITKIWKKTHPILIVLVSGILGLVVFGLF